jgi:hypothetical protein
MKYFYDTEFIEDGKTIDLISIGVAAEDGREFYAESADCNLTKADDWVRENVIRHLWSRQGDKREGNAWSRDGGVGGLLSRELIARTLVSFCDPTQFGKPEFWAYYGDYDHVALCQLFGRMIDLPEGWPMLTYDLRQWLNHYGKSDIKQPDDAPHNALEDARWVRDTYLTVSQSPILRP